MSIPPSPRRRLLLSAVSSCVVLSRPSWAADVSGEANKYPVRPLKMIVPYAAGGGYDIIGRMFGQELTAQLGQPVVVENRPGAAGIAGTEAAARATADGYTLLLGGGTMAINPGLYKQLPYDPVTSFEPVSMVARSALVLVVPATLPITNIDGLVAYAKKQPNGLTYASAGAGTPLHLAGELFSRLAGIKMVHVPYKGSAPALADVAAGRVDLMFDVPGTSLPFIRSNHIRPIAVTSAQRSTLLPDVPTAMEQGVKDLDISSWFAFFLPAGTSPSIVQRLNEALVKAADTPAVRQRLTAMGLETATSTSQALRSIVVSDKAKWGKIIADANVTLN